MISTPRKSTRKVVRRRTRNRPIPGKSLLPLLLGIALLTGCTADEDNPLSAKEEQLVGLWRLDIPAAIDAEDFEFTYEFKRDKSAVNRIGGAFLKKLQEQPELAEVDFGELENVDGGAIELRGRWNLAGDRLDVLFETIDVVLFGRVPVLGRLSAPVYFAELPAEQDYEVAYTCEIDGGHLTLKGQSLTVGVPLDEAAADELPPADLSPAGARALAMVADFIRQTVRQENLNQATFSKAR